MNKLIICCCLILSSAMLTAKEKKPLRESIDLSGLWTFSLDSLNQGIDDGYFYKNFSETVILPGTTDTNQKGNINTNKDESTQLSRKYKYEGVAWYNKNIEIPTDWKDKLIYLDLERTRPTTVWIDGVLVGNNNNISTPQRYELSRYLTPGKTHHLAIRVDNGESIPKQIRLSSHACTESTQTNWNGIIGRMELNAINKTHISALNVYPNFDNKSATIKVELSNSNKIKGKNLKLTAQLFNTNKKHNVEPINIPLSDGVSFYEFEYPLGADACGWSEFDPALYHLTAEIDKTDSLSINFGLRDFKTDGIQFKINDKKIFLRGKHDACVFPITAHAPMDLESWRRYFRICKEYGINHCRFHSWCPPKACFEAADLEGIYLQPELPIWGTLESSEQALIDFLYADGENIQKEYSNHASFVMFALGNELFGDVDIMGQLVAKFRNIDSRHIYAYGSNNFVGYKGYIPEEDFLVTCRLGGGEGYSTHTRGSFSFTDADDGGYINHTYPNSEMNFSDVTAKCPIPIISHETAQFQVYPNYNQIDKYTGVLVPWNLEIFKDRLDKAGMSNQAEDFFKASGALSALLYRADIEMCLRSNIGGFQLLDLQDYPGQGSAYVGMLDAFMDSKGLISPVKWREFCNDIVPLFETSKFCWTANEKLRGSVKIANYSDKDLSSNQLLWKLRAGDKLIAEGSYPISATNGLIEVGEIVQQLPKQTKPIVLSLDLSIENDVYKNSYPLWLYPNEQELLVQETRIARDLSLETLKLLSSGQNVILFPDSSLCRSNTVAGLFQTDYWNYRMFKTISENANRPVSPGTLGILTDPNHPLFIDFPTEYHTNWQWFPTIKESNPLILDELTNYKPIVQVIDNIERNHKLGLIFEFKVGEGNLLICMSDLEKVYDKPEAKQLYQSLINYSQSDYFDPQTKLTEEQLKALFSERSDKNDMKSLHNISYQ